MIKIQCLSCGGAGSLCSGCNNTVSFAYHRIYTDRGELLFCTSCWRKILLTLEMLRNKSEDLELREIVI